MHTRTHTCVHTHLQICRFGGRCINIATMHIIRHLIEWIYILYIYVWQNTFVGHIQTAATLVGIDSSMYIYTRSSCIKRVSALLPLLSVPITLMEMLLVMLMLLRFCFCFCFSCFPSPPPFYYLMLFVGGSYYPPFAILHGGPLSL